MTMNNRTIHLCDHFCSVLTKARDCRYFLAQEHFSVEAVQSPTFRISFSTFHEPEFLKIVVLEDAMSPIFRLRDDDEFFGTDDFLD